MHANGWAWGALTFRRRPITGDHPLVHASVRARMSLDPSYELPLELSETTWDDVDWLKPHPAAPERRPSRVSQPDGFEDPA
jgi:hypothetical protein